jgi:putative endonuclease
MHRERRRQPSTRSAASPQASHELGRLGERLAGEHFERLGFGVLERNVRTRSGEIDLIAFDGHTLVFVEVKTARVGGSIAADGQTPLARLQPRQRARLRRQAAAWLCDRSRPRPTARTVRLDAVGVVLDGAGRLLRLEHLEAAW